MRKFRFLCLLLALCLCLCSCKSSDYSKAKELFDAGEYQQAKEAFVALADYEDSAEMAKKCDYQLGLKLLEAGNFTDAKEAFAALGDYEDAPELAKKCDYQLAKKLLEEGKNQDALDLLRNLGDYEDSQDLVVECVCSLARSAADKGHLPEAVALLADLYQYAPAEDLFCTLLMEEITNNYMANVLLAQEEWGDYLVVWLKAFQANANKTAVGATISIPKVDTSAPQVIAIQRYMNKANESIDLVREAYNEEVLKVCDEDISTLVTTIFQSTETIDKQFKNLDSWATTMLFYGIQEKNAAKANNTFNQALYNIQDALDVVMKNRT